MNEMNDAQTSRQEVDADKDELLDGALRAVRGDAPGEELVADAADRVWRELADSSDVAGVTDYLTLVPDYLAGRLGDAQMQLFEQELKESVALRHALESARQGGDHAGDAVPPVMLGAIAPGPSRARSPRGRSRWLLATAAALVAAVAALLLVPMLTVPDQGRLARVDLVQGLVYRGEDGMWVPLSAGDWIDGEQTLATKMNATAVVVLDDGSRLEIGPRSHLTMSREGDGKRVQIDRGRIIVQAARQVAGTFDVATADFLVAVKGTIFEVSHGTKGSRVSVIEGEVEVRQGGESTSLRAGDQLSTRKTVAAGVEDSISWSRDADRYVEMLRSYVDLKREIETVLTTTRRHSTRLLDLAPARTAIYIGVPNAPAMIAEAYEVVESFGTRMLAGHGPASEEPAWIDDVLAWLAEVGDHVGDETVVAVRWDDKREAPMPLLLAEVRADGLEDLIGEMLPTLTGAKGGPGVDLEIVAEPGEARTGVLSVWLTGDLLAVAMSPELLLELEAVLGGGDNPFVGSELHASLGEVYERGAEYLAGADLVRLEFDRLVDPTGNALFNLGGALTAIVEHHQDHQQASTTLEVRFDGGDENRIAWLDRPGPMGALEFFSSEATVAGAVVVRNPRQLLDSVLGTARNAIPDDPAGLALVEDLFGAFGGELAIAIDGPLLPVPSWKAVVGVYEQSRLQETVESLVAFVAGASGDSRIGIQVVDAADTPEAVYRLSIPGMSAYYSYIDGYLVAAATPALVEHARQTQASGVTLLDAGKFQSLLPLDTYVDFSAVAYSRLGEVLTLPWGRAGLVENGQLDGTLRELAGTALFGVYNEPDRIRVVTNGDNAMTLFGLSLLPGVGDAFVNSSGSGT